MPDGVLDQRVEREREPFPVGLCRHAVQPAGPPAPVGRRPPAPDQLRDQLVKGKRLRVQECRVGGGGDDEKPFGDPPQPGQLADDDRDVLTLLAVARERAGQQLGVAEADRDRRPQLVGGVLQEPPLLGQDPGDLRGDQLVRALGRQPAPGVPGHREEHRCHQRYLGELGGRLMPSPHVDSDADRRQQHHRAKHPQRVAGPPGAEPVDQGQADPDEVERDGFPAGEHDNEVEVGQAENHPGRVDQAAPVRADPLRHA